MFIDIIGTINRTQIPNSNVIIIGENDTTNGSRFQWLMERGLTLLSLDTSEVRKKELMAGQSGEDELYVNIVEVIEVALRIIFKKYGMVGQNPKLQYDPEINPHFAVFKICPDIMSAGLIARIYRAQLKALKSA